jgi:hypothetical protein
VIKHNQIANNLNIQILFKHKNIQNVSQTLKHQTSEKCLSPPQILLPLFITSDKGEMSPRNFRQESFFGSEGTFS